MNDRKPPGNEDHAGKAAAAAASLAAKAAERSGNAEVESETTTQAAPSVADGGTPVEGSALSEQELEQLTADIIAALKTVQDPEIPSDIYELGLIYRVDVGDEREVEIDMTLTAPGCPVAGEMPGWVEDAVSSVPGVKSVTVKLVFDPPWDMSRMSDEARLEIGMF
ncbi:MAG: SUF system Fe-S cluster assembly protein [Alphaproteobacteria bacterium]|nr:SUF system Fe-S cluster assembly protein [Alphaproteobacteria bacterium]